MPPTVTRVLPALACALVLTACGSGETTSSQTRTALQQRVAALVTAVNAQDYPTARTSLDALRADVEDAQRLGALADTRAVELIRLADGVEAGLPSPPPPPAPAPAPAATRAPTTAPSPDEPAVQPPPNQEPGKGKSKDGDKDDRADD